MLKELCGMMKLRSAISLVECKKSLDGFGQVLTTTTTRVQKV